METEKTYDVFLSYHSGDREAVVRIKDHLQSRGLKVWLDRDQIRPGDIFVGALEDGLESSKSIAFFISPGAVESGWVREEYSRALVLANDKKHRLRIIPVILDEAPLPSFITSRQYVDFRDKAQFENGINDLIWGITGDPRREQKIDPIPNEKRGIGIDKTTRLIRRAIIVFAVLVVVAITLAIWQLTKADRSKTVEFETVVLNDGGQVVERLKRSAVSLSEDLGEGVELKMVKVEGGTFNMGTNDADVAPLTQEFTRYYKTDEEKQRYAKWPLREIPRHPVTVPGFYIGMYEVTQKQWRIVSRLPKVNRDLEDSPSKSIGDDRPVERVSWLDAMEFCERLSKKTGKNYRLPTEAEWEYSCRAGTDTAFAFGKSLTTNYANYDGRYPFGAAPGGVYLDATNDVGKYLPNRFGIFDMHGNVWEWCSDVWHPNYNGAPSDGSSWNVNGEAGYRVIRGGSYWWFPVAARSAGRSILLENDRDDPNGDHGFRVALSY